MEDFENPLIEDEPRRRPAPRRTEYAWEKVVAASKAPDVHFTCCGVEYGATSAQTLSLMRQAHNQAKHPRSLALGEEV